ncbi:sigma-54-dependent Fis family transcriptional regulator [Polaromonas sp.]|uniref:sigma-54-dependent Fis family transcriptional regulator n=1 Tax=Polaromonas sp. TaxID=1869339 RepID=UPI0017C60CFD|nr:sigma-54-dependent Fis family transcriptional regulator [Polaromonas sp.]NMM04739.1 sigma-54-dependent Fis family transcriptional regulator [Polaromonas sp.]
MLSVQSHCTRIREVVHCMPAARSASLQVPGYVTDSWIRCSNEFKLDPTLPGELYVVERQELLSRQQQLSSVLRAAKCEMATLYQQIARAGYAIMLTDCEGVLLNYFGDPGFTHAASKSGLLPGAVWSERFQGTNGMGTCLREQRPMMIHQGDHYLFRNTGLTCAAAPILDWRGKTLAVLDASGESHRAPIHVLDLVNMSVQEIENQIFVNEYRDRRLFVFHTRPEFVSTLSKGILAIDGNGRVLAASRNALVQLGVGRDGIIGQPLDDFFNMRFESLLRECQKHAQTPVMVFDARHGRRFFALALAAPLGNKSVPPAIGAVVASAASGNSERSARTPLEQLQFGHDPVMTRNIETALRIAERDVPILIYGETGTGKELFAKAVHLSSNRAHQPYVAINCASIPESLIESELFGYKSGAFTGASKEGQRGKIIQANGGTLFLDEIGDMPIALQARLLRVLEEREVAPLGSETPIRLDIRLISATHCDLPEKIAKNEFREDLYYRIQGLTLTLPPLRERADRRALIQFLLTQELPADACVTIDDDLMAALEQHRWPGNIRQLRNVLRTMVVLRNSDILTRECLPANFFGSKNVAGALIPPPAPNALRNPLESAERDALIQELKMAGWNLSKVAKQLKLSRNTLYRKLHRLGIETPSRENYQ